MAGQEAPLVWALTLVLAAGTPIGLANGIGIAVMGLLPIVMTLAMNGFLQGVALLYSQGTPAGYSAPTMPWLMTGKVWGVAPVVALVALFVLFSVLLLGRAPFGRRVCGIGNGERVAAPSGSAVPRTRTRSPCSRGSAPRWSAAC